MGVYISGLKMPQNGRVTLQIDSNGGVYVVNKFSITSEKYEKYMIATRIQPHGRLIDADAIQDYNVETFGQRLLIIDTAPTVIEAED